MSVLRASILCSKVKKGGPERVKRGPEGLSLFKITPEKACSFFAPRGARCKAARRDNFAGNTFPVSKIAFDNPIARDHLETFVTHASGGDDVMLHEEHELLPQGITSSGR